MTTAVPRTFPRLTVVLGTSRRFAGRAENMTILKLDYQDGHLELPVREAAEGAPGMSVDGLLDRAGYVTYDPGFVNTASCVSAVTYIDGDAGILRYRGLPDRGAGRAGLLPRGVLPAHLRRAADRAAAGRLHRAGQPAHAAARGSAALLRRLPARRAPDAGAVVGGERAVDLLPGQPRPVRPAAGGHLHGPAAGQAADDRLVRVQEVDRAAAALPGQQPRIRARTSCA